MKTAYLIFNPYAGRFPSRILTERAAAVLSEQNWDVQLKQSSGGSEITDIAIDAVENNQDAVFVAGGDGSINLAIAGLLGSDTALGVLPAGTTNVWAQELGLPGLGYTRLMALEESARQLVKGISKKVDIGSCNGHPFLMWCGVGLDGFIVHRIEPRSNWEKHFSIVSYGARAIRYASLWSGVDLRAIADGKQISGRYLLAVISNIHLYAGGKAKISPEARIDDGVMDLWLFEGQSILDTIQHAWNLFSGRHLYSDQSKCIQFRSLRLFSNQTLEIQIDGEPMAGTKEVIIEIRPKALKILVPSQAHGKLFAEER
ncbi:MAG: diacylglycerol/lipid kinase family protein [Anaerolineales bacterium]